jgi:hypothetical protein
MQEEQQDTVSLKMSRKSWHLAQSFRNGTQLEANNFLREQ